MKWFIKTTAIIIFIVVSIGCILDLFFLNMTKQEKINYYKKLNKGCSRCDTIR